MSDDNDAIEAALTAFEQYHSKNWGTPREGKPGAMRAAINAYIDATEQKARERKLYKKKAAPPSRSVWR